MGTVTIINNTNTTINSGISAAVYYSTVAKLSPGQFYEHNGAAGTYTLSVNYWFGEETELHNNPAEIGLWVGGVVLGVLGVVAACFSGGAGAPVAGAGFSMAACAAAGLGSGAAGLAISGISIAIDDFRNTPSKWTNIQAIQNRRFVAYTDTKIEANPDAKGNVVFTKIPEIKLKEISEAEFQGLIADGKLVGYRPVLADAAQLPTTYATRKELEDAKLLDKPLRLFPSLGGSASWEIEGDGTADGSALQLWERNTAKVNWSIKAVTDTQFALLNKELDRYATCPAKGDTTNTRVTAARKRTDHDRQLFRIGKSGNHWVFFPDHDLSRSVIPEDGNQGNSTKLVVRPNMSANPGFARWKVVAQ